MKKIPVNIRVMRAIGATMPKGAKVKDIAKVTGMNNQNISACLWKLKEQGKVSRDADGVYRLINSALTPVNKEVEAQVQAPALEANDESKTLTLGKVARNLAKENQYLKDRIEMTQKALREARDSSLDFERKYFDALAVIKYLEDK